MRAKYLGNGWGNWKGVDLSPGLEFDVPERLHEIVRSNANFEVIDAPAKRGPGRPRKSDENEG